jgi:hypothetical protein
MSCMVRTHNITGDYAHTAYWPLGLAAFDLASFGKCLFIYLFVCVCVVALVWYSFGACEQTVSCFA